MADTIQRIDHIVKTPGVLGGKPRIAGRRIAVHQIAENYLRHGVSVEELVEAYDLTPAQVYAALAYYYDHREEIDALIQADEDTQARIDQAADDPAQRALREKFRQRMEDPDREMTAPEAAAEFGISAQAVREACQAGWVPARKSGATWLIRRTDAVKRWGQPHRGSNSGVE